MIARDDLVRACDALLDAPRDALLDAVQSFIPAGCLEMWAPEFVDHVAVESNAVQVRLRSGHRLVAPLCVAADGKFSRLRTQAGIKTLDWTYGQSGLVATVRHAFGHDGLAQEYFLPGGPFAILPMTGNRSSLVWTERSEAAKHLIDMNADDFLAQLRARFGSYLGEVSLAGPVWSYPLSLVLAERFVGDRLALVGDAAHAIHPIAGQGFNLGLRDIAALIEVVVDAKRLGLDIGGAGVLERYQRWRRFDSVVLAVVTDALNRLFANDIGPIRLVRDAGLSVVNQAGPLRRLLMKHAAGHVGDRPKLLRGQPI